MQQVLSKNRLKVYKSLRLKKGRLKERAFLVEGHKSVHEALTHSTEVLAVVSAVGFEGLPDHFSYFETDQKTYEELTSMSTSPGILAVVRIPDWYNTSPSADALKAAHTILYLDGIRDPGNLGTIIRTAAWFGNYLIVMSEDCADLFNPKVVQATMGASFKQPAYTSSLERIKGGGQKAYGMDMEGESLFGFNEPGIFVIGSESHGIKEETRAAIDSFVSIPGEGSTESLNAGLAAGILMAERFRLTHQ